MTPLLDTHILLWWLEDRGRLPASHRRVIRRAGPDAPLLVSEISLWEIATLHALGRIRLGLPLRDWLEQAVAPPLVRRCGISPAVAAETTALPASFPRDPADRLIAATARLHGATLLTCDRRIIETGAVPVLS